MSNDTRITHTVVPATIVAGFAATNPACALSAEPASPQHDMMRATALAPAFAEAVRMLRDRAAAEASNNPAPMHAEVIAVRIEEDLG
jgi:hypothetical protein